jgi:hypothetical protein
MKRLLFILFVLCSLCAKAQEPVVYKYIIAEPQGKLFSDKCKLRIDDGIKPTKAKGDSENSITFRSYAAALMYLTSQGWELVSNYSTTSGSSFNGTGASSTSTYWILRKPSTKEEVQEIIDQSIRNDD